MIKVFDEDTEMKEEIKEGMILIDFFATWCGPCQMIAGELEELSASDDTIKILKIDIDRHPEIAKEYGVMAVPTLLFIKDGDLLERQTGFMPKEKIIEIFKK